jgi:hypothetical protein
MSKCKIGLESLDMMLASAPKLRSLKFCAIERSAILDWERAMHNNPHLVYPSLVTDVTHLTWRDAETFVSMPVLLRLLLLYSKLASLELAAELVGVARSTICLFVANLCIGRQLKAIATNEMDQPYYG